MTWQQWYFLVLAILNGITAFAQIGKYRPPITPETARGIALFSLVSVLVAISF